MNAALKKKCLILNANAQPLSTWPLSLVPATEAVHAWYRDRVTIIEAWPDLYFRSPSTKVAVPKIAMLKYYAKTGNNPKFCRRNLVLRDEWHCLYCLEVFSSEDLSFDHVLPRALGGKTTWENVVCACLKCNSKKSNRIDMMPIRMPHRPTTTELLRKGLKYLPKEIVENYGDFLYWNIDIAH